MTRYITVTNNTNMPIYVGAEMVPPNDNRQFPEDQVPMHLRPAEEVQAPAAAPNPVLEIVKLKAADLKKRLVGLSDDMLHELMAAEQATETPRKGVVQAIDELLLDRASNKEQALSFLSLPEAEVVESLAAVEKIEDLELLKALETEGQNRPAVLTAIDTVAGQIAKANEPPAQ